MASKKFSLANEHKELDDLLSKLNSGKNPVITEEELPDYNDPSLLPIKGMLLTPQQREALNREVELQGMENNLANMTEEDQNETKNMLETTEKNIKPFQVKF